MPMFRAFVAVLPPKKGEKIVTNLGRFSSFYAIFFLFLYAPIVTLHRVQLVQRVQVFWDYTVSKYSVFLRNMCKIGRLGRVKRY
jgi:hypothetical protein